MRRTIRAVGIVTALTVTLGVSGCSSSSSGEDAGTADVPASCRLPSDCPAGTYCGPAQACTFDCRQDRDCVAQGLGATCDSASGRCLGAGADAAAGADGATTDVPTSVTDATSPIDAGEEAIEGPTLDAAGMSGMVPTEGPGAATCETVARPMRGIPWVSQKLARLTWNHNMCCGPAVVTMAAAAARGATSLTEADLTATIDWMSRHIDGWSARGYDCSGTDNGPLVATLTEYAGLAARARRMEWCDLVGTLDDRHVVIFHGDSQGSNTSRLFRAGASHWVILRSVDGDSTRVNDPGRTTSAQGANREYTTASVRARFEARGRLAVIVDIPTTSGAACMGRVCGPDPSLGMSCGSCPATQRCTPEGACMPICTPGCAGRTCGGDGCGGSCGTCASGQMCMAGSCAATPCVAECGARVCGPDPRCGQSCGTCSAGRTCNAEGRCACVQNCAGRTCGDDGCGGSCGSCASDQRCGSSGRCEEVCPAPTRSCGGTCANLSSDPSNCGSCGNRCGSTETCSGGVCAPVPCSSGTVRCSGSCVDTQSSADHCGSCGNRCASGRCSAGACLLDAPTGVTASFESGANYIRWNAVPGATRYTVFWTTSSAGVTEGSMALSPTTSTAYAHSGVLAGYTYYYRVRAESGSTYSALSSQASVARPVTTRPSAPTGVSVRYASGCNIVSWNPVPTATDYNVHWGTSSGITGGMALGFSPTTESGHCGVASRGNYCYRPFARNAAGNSDLGAEVCIRVP